ncbi:MAG: hypothetical protein EF813_09630 [Methanosarcinales archaeon]|nr:MAG: hypothetical protein EF813_09630 [Methanosarcinales archaeon]
MWKKSEIKYKWIYYKYWIYYLIPTLVVVSILYCIHPNECPDNARYILSAISQGLAAILALVFTITLVVAQMTRRYTAMDKIIFRSETKFLMILFGIGIIAPLLVLEFGFWKWGVPLSIVTASFCVFSLLPFLIGVNSVLKYDIAVEILDEETMEAIELGYEPRAINKIRELNEIGESAVREFREDDVMEIVGRLSIIGEESAKKRFKHATLLVADGIIGMGIGSIENELDDIRIVKNAVIGLKNIGVEAAKNRLEGLSEVVPKAINGLTKVGTKAAEKKLVGTTISAVSGLKDIIVEYRYLFSWDNIPGTDNERFLKCLITYHDINWAKSAKIRKSDDDKTIYLFTDENSAEITIDETGETAILKINDGRIHDIEVKKENHKLNLRNGGTELKGERDKYIEVLKDTKNILTAVKGVWCLGAFVTKYMPKQADTVIQSLKEIEKEIGKDSLMKWEWEKNCTNKHPHLKSSFEKFKRRYDGR